MLKKMLCVFVWIASSLQAVLGVPDCVLVNVGAGIRQDDLKWKMSGLTPGVEIRERWKDINYATVVADLHYLTCNGYLFNLEGDYAWAEDRNKHTVASHDSDSSVYFRRRFRTKGRAYDVSGSVGYQFSCFNLSWAPLFGFSYSQQRFENPPFYASQHVCQQSQHTQCTWYGPWIGLGGAFEYDCRWLIYAKGAFHLARNHAKADELLSHRKSSRDAHGAEGTLGFDYRVYDSLAVGLKFNYKSFWATKKRHYNIGRVEWDSYYLVATLGFAF